MNILNFLAAFDTIEHSILLEKLAELRVEGTVLQWFCSYLAEQFQKQCGGFAAQPCDIYAAGSYLIPHAI